MAFKVVASFLIILIVLIVSYEGRYHFRSKQEPKTSKFYSIPLIIQTFIDFSLQIK
jgi:hypothetical protein